MKITIERGKQRFEVVPCGNKCSYAKDGCVDGCFVPKWYWGMMVDKSGKKAGRFCGLRKVDNCEK